MSNALKLIAAFTFGVLAWSAAPAAAQQAQGPAPQVVSQFDDLTIRYLLADMQVEWTVERGETGDLVYRAIGSGNMNFMLMPAACRPGEGCVGLVLMAVFTGLQPNNVGQLDAYLHQFNDTYPSAKLIRTASGPIILQGFINATGGVSYRNVQAVVGDFLENIGTAGRALASFEQSQ